MSKEKNDADQVFGLRQMLTACSSICGPDPDSHTYGDGQYATLMLTGGYRDYLITAGHQDDQLIVTSLNGDGGSKVLSGIAFVEFADGSRLTANQLQVNTNSSSSQSTTFSVESRITRVRDTENGWPSGNVNLPEDTFATVTASTWGGTTSLSRVVKAAETGGVIQARQIERNTAMPTGSWLHGSAGNDVIRGLAGWDILSGDSGDDLIRAGNGRDILTGGLGSDELHGDFGWNTYTSERDGFVDLIAIKSDQHLINWWYGKAGNSPNGEKADILEGLDEFDQIRIIGIATENITFAQAYAKGVRGIGIFAKGTLEALYIGGNLSIAQLETMTTGDDSPAAMDNKLWSYWHGNETPSLVVG